MPPTNTHRRSEGPNVWSRRVVFALHAGAAIALAIWVRTLAPAAGIAAAVGLGVVAIGASRERRRPDVVAFLGLSIAAGVIVALNGRALRTAAMATDSPALVSQPIERDLADEIMRAQRQLSAAATSAAGGTSVRAALPDLDSETGLIVFFVGTDSAHWAGRTVVPAAALLERAGVVVTPFYVVQYAAVLNRSRLAVATSVVHANPPTDRLTRALTTSFGGSPAVHFDVADVTVSRAAPGTLVDIGGARLAIRATVRDAAAFAAGVEQSARTHAAAVLLLATIASLAVLLRRAERLRDRIASVAIPMVVIAITPLNALSNVTRLFDASTYYVEGGGPYTASVGALAMASALVLFVVMASVRVRTRHRPRWAALLAVLVVAGAAPYLLRYLARGINLPPSGPTTALWLAWEVALFLAAMSFLTAGVGAGQGALGAKRGLPLWVGPLLASIAALLGPALLGHDGSWPQWYPAIWVTAIGALVLARRSRAVLLSSAFVAACGATVLLWGATIRERVRLASRDVATLGMTEGETHTLLDRLASDAAQGGPPTTRAQLLALFASADLAATDFPVSLAFWPLNSAPTLLPIRGGTARREVESIVTDARASQVPVQRTLPSNPAAAVALAVPYATGGVFTAVVESRARLSRTQSFPDLFGVWEEPPNPPYQLALVPTIAGPDTVPWTRLGTHLHAELTLVSNQGAPVRVRADVVFDPYETLVPVGLLIVLFDLVIVVVLIGADLFAGGVLGRWIRMRRTRWRRSYRLQLTFALFAFFIVPAMAFALWSYRRLHTDDRAARELLVREALRRAYVPPGTDSVKEIPRDVPHFIYRGGQLVGVSDSLLLAVAPTGQWLEPTVQRLLSESDEIVATTPIRVGRSALLFGFRALSEDLVAAVPARSDEASITKRRSDLGVLVVLATVLGALAALGLSGVAARKLARPIGALRGAALAVAGGSREPLGSTDAPAEFVPVFRAFDRMARDLAASEAQLTRAERVLAWGEMARQVAHEIKNPLTPIRLGVQHVLRAWRDGRPDFDSILEENSSRLLREIDHLDATARSFSRFGTMPDAPAPAEIIDVAAVVRDVVSLEALGADAIEWRVSGADDACPARARAHELREVLLNLCENSRNAFARVVDIRLEQRDGRITLSVVDDGEGVPRHLHSRVFEPHFSTRTSGSGLGLAISRQLVESWGASIDLYSEPNLGTTVRIILDASKDRPI